MNIVVVIIIQHVLNFVANFLGLVVNVVVVLIYMAHIVFISEFYRKDLYNKFSNCRTR